MLHDEFVRRRQELSMLQSDLAKAANMNQARISQLETGKGDPGLGTLEKVAQALRARIVLIPLEKLSEVEKILGAPPAGANLSVGTAFDDLFIPDPTDTDPSGKR